MTSVPQQQLSFINIGGPTDAKTAFARREVRAEAARRSAEQRRATIAERYGSHSAARKAGKGVNAKQSSRRKSTASTDRRVKKRSNITASDKSLTQESSRPSASASICRARLPTPPRETMALELEPTDLDVALHTGLDHSINSAIDSVARGCGASTDSELQTAIASDPEAMIWPTQASPLTRFSEQDIRQPVTSADDFINNPLRIDMNTITPPLESPCVPTPPMTMPNTPAWPLDTSPPLPRFTPPTASVLPPGLALLRDQHLLPEDLLFTVAQTVHVSPRPDTMWMLHGIASALFARHMPGYQTIAKDELSAHVALHVRLAAALLVDMAAPGVVDFLPHAISEQHQHLGLFNPGTVMGTDFDEILLWALVVIWAAKGRASEQQTLAMQQLVVVKGIDSAAALTAVMERFVCPQWLRPAVHDLWHYLARACDGTTAATSMIWSGLTWMS